MTCYFFFNLLLEGACREVMVYKFFSQSFLRYIQYLRSCFRNNEMDVTIRVQILVEIVCILLHTHSFA